MKGRSPCEEIHRGGKNGLEERSPFTVLRSMLLETSYFSLVTCYLSLLTILSPPPQSGTLPPPGHRGRKRPAASWPIHSSDRSAPPPLGECRDQRSMSWRGGGESRGKRGVR